MYFWFMQPRANNCCRLRVCDMQDYLNIGTHCISIVVVCNKNNNHYWKKKTIHISHETFYKNPKLLQFINIFTEKFKKQTWNNKVYNIKIFTTGYFMSEFINNVLIN
jgi:hypothetical protein